MKWDGDPPRAIGGDSEKKRKRKRKKVKRRRIVTLVKEIEFLLPERITVCCHLLTASNHLMHTQCRF